MDCFQRSSQINPDNADALYNLGNAFARLGKVDEAIIIIVTRWKLTEHADVLANLGFALAAKKQFDEAVAWFEQALQLDPDAAEAHNNFATSCSLSTSLPKPRNITVKPSALRLQPADYANLGDALVKLGLSAEAPQNYQTALRLNPDDARTRAKLQALGAQLSN